MINLKKLRLVLFLVSFCAAFSAKANLTASISLDSNAPSAIYPTQETRLSVTLANSGGVDLTDVAFDVVLPGVWPAGLRVSSAASYSCTNYLGSVVTSGTLAAEIGSSRFALSGGLIPARANNRDGECTILVPVTVGNTDNASYTVTIPTGAVTALESGASISNSGSVSQSINVTQLQNYTVQESYSVASVYQGDEPTLTITVTNPNPVPISNYSITHTFNAAGHLAVAPLPSASSSCNNSGGVSTFTPSQGDGLLNISGTLPAKSGGTDGVCTFIVRLKATGSNSASSVNTSSVISGGANDIDAIATKNAATLTIRSGILVTEVLGHRGNYYAGDWKTLTITIANRSSVEDLTGLGFSLVDHIRKGASVNSSVARGLEFRNISTTCIGGVASISGTTLNFTGGSLARNSSCTISTDYKLYTDANSSTTSTFYGVIPVNLVSSSSNFYSPSSYTTTDYLYVISPLSVSQQWQGATSSGGSSTVPQGESRTLTIALNNASQNPINITSFTKDPIDGLTNSPHPSYGLNVIGGSTTCVGGTVASTSGGYGFTLTGGLIPDNGSCTVTLTFVGSPQTGATSSVFSNSIGLGAVQTSDPYLVSGSSFSGNLTVRSPLEASVSYALTSTPAGSITTLSSGVSGRLKLNLSNSSSTDIISGIQLRLDPLLRSSNSAGPAATALNVTAVEGGSCNGAQVALIGNTGISLSGLSLSAGGSCTINVDFSATPNSGQNSTPYAAYIVGSGSVGSQGTLSGEIAGLATISAGVTGSITITDVIRVSKSQLPGYFQSYPYGVAPGGPIKYTVYLDNYDDGAAQNNVRVLDNLPNGITFLKGQINGHNFDPAITGAGCGAVSTSNVTGDTSLQFGVVTIPQAPAGSYSRCLVTFWGMLPTTATATSYNTSFNNIISSGGVCSDNGNGNCNGGSAQAASARVQAPLSASFSYQNYSYNNSSYTSSPYYTSPNFYYYGYAGSPSRFRISLSNYTLNALTSTRISGTLPSSGSDQLQIAYPANLSTTCGSTPDSVSSGAVTFSLSGLTVPARTSDGVASSVGGCVVEFDVIGNAGIYTPSVLVEGATGAHADGAPVTYDNLTSTGTQFRFLSALSGSLSFSPNSLVTGRQTTATVTMSANASGETKISNVSFNHTLPSGLSLAPIPNARSTCDGSVTILAPPNSSSIQMTGAEIARGNSCQLIFDVVVNFPGAVGSTLTDTIASGDLSGESGQVSASQFSSTLTRALANTDNILLSMATNPSTLTFPGEVSRLQIAIRSGTTNLTNISQILYFTSDGTISGSSTGVVIAPNPQAVTNCTGAVLSALAGGSSISLSRASISANSECTIQVNVLSVLVGGKTIVAPSGSISTNEGATNLNTASTSLAVGSNIGVLKEFSPRVVSTNQRSRLKITFFNPTALPMSGLVATDTLPSGLVVPPGASPSTTCAGASVSAPSTGSVLISGGTIAATPVGAASISSCYAEIDVVSVAEGSYTNTIPVAGVTATVAGVQAANSEPAVDTLLVKSPLKVHVGLLNSGAVYRTNDTGTLPLNWQSGVVSKLPGATATLKLRLANENASGLSNIAFNLQLPVGVTLSSSPSTTNTCGGSLDVLNYGSYLRLSAGALSSSSSCEITANIVSSVSGSSNRILFGSSLVSTYEGITNIEPSSTTLEMIQPPLVGLEFSPSVIPPNGLSRLTINLGNPNSTAIALSPRDFENVLPSGLVVATTPNISTTCLGTIVANSGANRITYYRGSSSIPTGGCVITVDVTSASSGTYVNYIYSEQLQTTAGKNIDPASASLSVSTLGYVAGRVFLDNDVVPNGVFNISTDNGLYGASVALYAGSLCSGSSLATTTTNELGIYSFNGLSAGTYSVCQANQPVGTINGITSAGTTISVNNSTGSGGTPSNPSSISSQIIGIVLNGDGNSGAVSGSDGNNFAEIVPSSISGTVFSDINNNGVQNGSDLGISNVTINILNSGNMVVSTTTTNALGFYEFSGLVPGTYYLEQPTQPAGTANGQTLLGIVSNGGSSGAATATNVLPSRIGPITLPPNTIATGFNFAEISNNRTIYGWIFLDRNADGSKNGVDAGLAGQTINLSGTDVNGNSVSRTVTTSIDGSYAFTGLPEGASYTLTQLSQPTGTTNGNTSAGSTGGAATAIAVTPSAISGIDLSGLNTISAENNFAELPVASPDLTISITKSTTDFNVGSQAGTYVITPNNYGDNSTTGNITIAFTTPSGMTPTSATGTGWTCAIVTSVVSCSSSSVIPPGLSGNTITVEVSVDLSKHGSVLTSVGEISGGGEPSSFNGNNSSSLSVSVLGTGSLSGTVWRDSNKNLVPDSGETLLQGWYAKLYRDGVLVDTVQTNSNGMYQFIGAIPGNYQIRFSTSSGGAVFGRPVLNQRGMSSVNNVVDSIANPLGATTADGTIRLTLTQGDNITELGMPVPTDPSGVIYDAVTRNPVSGVGVTLSGPTGFTSAHVVGGELTQLTGSDGAYQFWLLSNAPSGTYTISVTGYPSGYIQSNSSLIPVCSGTLTVDVAPNPALVHQSATAPSTGANIHDPATCPSNSSSLSSSSTSTQYYSSFYITPGTSADVLNNHIPIDPQTVSATNQLFAVSKVGSAKTVEIGDSLLYTIKLTYTNGTSSATSQNGVIINDTLPLGFKYISNSALYVNGGTTLRGDSALGITGVGPQLQFNVGDIQAAPGNSTSATLTYRVRVGVGAQNGTGINSAIATSTNGLTSNRAQFKVKITLGVFAQEGCIVGKVYLDCNKNGMQDEDQPNELGIPGVRLYLENGTFLVSDSEGKYSLCDISPTTHVFKVDPITLPEGAQLGITANRNAHDPESLFIDMKSGELHRADFVEQSCSVGVLNEVQKRRARKQVVPVVRGQERSQKTITFESDSYCDDPRALIQSECRPESIKIQ